MSDLKSHRTVQRHSARRIALGVAMAASLFATVAPTSTASPSVASGTAVEEDQQGRRILTDSKCQRCHAVSTADIAMEEGARMKGPDLAQLSAQMLESKGLEAYLRRTETKNGKRHPFPWRGSDEDLQRLVDWMLRHQANEGPEFVASAR